MSLRNQLDRVNAAIAALEGSTGTRGGRTSTNNGGDGPGNSRRRGRRSAAVRKRMSDAQKKRWAAKK